MKIPSATACVGLLLFCACGESRLNLRQAPGAAGLTATAGGASVTAGEAGTSGDALGQAGAGGHGTVGTGGMGARTAAVGGAGAGSRGTSASAGTSAANAGGSGGGSGGVPQGGAGGLAALGGAGAAGATSVAGGTGVGGAAALNAGPCTLWPATPAAPPAEFTFNGTTVRADEHDCAWTLGTTSTLPTPSPASRLFFHYDVNGDGIDDLFVGPPSWSMTSNQKEPMGPILTMLASKLDGGDLSFEPTGCLLAWQSTSVYRLRDLDGDGVPDFVVSTGTGIQVLMNRPSGPELTVDYLFPTPTVAQPSAEILDAVVGDFDGDGALELATSFKRNEDPANTQKVGTLLFHAPASATAEHGPDVLFESDWQSDAPDYSVDSQLGLITGLKGNASLFGVATWSGWLYEQGQTTKIQNAMYPYGSIFIDNPVFFAPIVVNQRDLLLAGLTSHIELFDPWKNEDVTDFTILHTPYGFLDIDGDGDGELIEYDGTDPASVDLDIHNGNAETGPEQTWHDLNPRDWSDPGSETPFLKTGRAQGRLLVTGADWQLTDMFPIRVAALACGQ